MNTLPPGLKQISEQEAMRRIANKVPGFIAAYTGHDVWCQTLKTGKPLLCNCNAVTEYFVVELPEGRRN